MTRTTRDAARWSVPARATIGSQSPRQRRMLAPVEALLAAAAALVVIALALVLLARGWPRSSRRTGYRISGHATDDEPPVREEDDTRWRWRDR